MQPSKTLLKVYLNQFDTSNRDLIAEKAEDFERQWRSSKLILDTIEVWLSKELHKLIQDDENIHNTEIPNPDIKRYYNLGERKRVRQIRNELFGKIETGDE